MVVDTSILLAILLQEPRWEEDYRRLESVACVKISTGTYLEARIVLLKKFSDTGERLFEDLLDDLRIEIWRFDAIQARIAAAGYQRFGKGRHPATLNFGDCFSYALAKQLNEPLFFKGDDFSKTDVLIA